MIRFSFLAIVCFLCFSILLIGGCGTGNRLDTQYVEGIVTLDGEPLAEANVKFRPTTDQGETAGGYTDSKGKYSLSSQNGDPGKGALAGEYTVTVSKMKITASGAQGIPSLGDKPVSTAEETIPGKYSDRKETTLTAVVNKGKNQIDFKLETK